MNLQSFNTEDDVHALFLHALAPLDVALLVETCQKLYHGSYLLAVAGSGDERLDYLGILRQTIEGGLDGLYLWLGSSLTEYTDVAVEAMIGYMDKAVLLTNLVEDALVGEEFRLHDRSPLLVFQFLVSAIRERHQILMVLVSSSSQ